ncbi:hypothetical protein RB653_004546 [Dictyostelium firmibasis]|uniref:Condensin complex subunit 1 C-terminal domain-containing protein n=1 Tax=Dictyostelium firmibasis TaxID=79012 RepID=A0AAN7U7P1_9MYCE
MVKKSRSDEDYSGSGRQLKNNNGFDNILDFGIDKIPQETLNSIWRGDELPRDGKEIANHIANSIKNEQLESVLKYLRIISDSIPELDISTISYSSQQPSKSSKQKKQSKKKQNVNNKNKNKKRSSKKKKNESDEEEDDEEEKDKEEEEEEDKEEEEKIEKMEEDIQLQNEPEQTSNQFIEFLELNEISVQNLSALLYWLITSTAIKNQEVKFNAASIYSRMIVLVRKSFHPFIFRSVMKLFSVKKPEVKTPFSNNKKDSSKSSSQSQSQSQSQGEENEDEEQDDDANDEDNGENSENNGSKELNQKIWLKKVCILLEDMNWLFYRFSLASFSEPLTNSIESIANLARSQNFKKVKSKGQRANNQLDHDEKNVIDLSFKVLVNLTQENRHGPLQIVLPIILKEFINTLTLNPGKIIPPTVSKQLILDRDFVLDFIHDTLLPNPNTHEQIHILIQHICMRVMDRSEYRNHTVDSITKIFSNLSSHQRFINNFFITYSKNSKSHFRSFSVEVSLSLLQNFKSIKENFQVEEELLIQQLLGILVNRSSDKVSVVRSKALSCLSMLFENNDTLDLIKHHLKNVFDLDHYENKNEDYNSDKKMVDSDDEDEKQSNVNAINNDNGKKKPSLLSFLSKRSEDEKSAVRKSALQVLEVISLQNGATKPILNILLKKTNDSSPLVRKQVISTLTLLLKSYPNDMAIIDTWRKAVIPLITDREQTIMDKSLDSINEILFGSILNPENNTFIWKLLNDISIEMKPYLHKICGLMSSRKMITPQLIKSVQSIIKASKDENISGGWTLFSEISYCCPDKLDQALVIGAWNRLKGQVEDPSLSNEEHTEKVSLLCSVLTVIETLCTSILPLDKSNALFNEIYSMVIKFSYDPTITQLFIIILVKLTNRICKVDGSSKVNSVIADWTNNILKICDERLSKYALPNLLITTLMKPTTNDENDNGNVNSSSVDKGEKQQQQQHEDKIALYLFTIGEIIQIPQAIIPGRLRIVVQALIAPRLMGDEGELIPTSIRAHAFITLGKLCLGDDKMAKKCIATFAKELEISESPIIRNNVMVVMCDLCIRYTQLVDNYIPNIAMCLRDPSELVRRQTLVLLTRLLQEDYVKWRGSLFFRFVEALVDPSPIVKQFANYCLMNVLQIKYGTIQGGPGGASGGNANTAKDHHGNVFFTHFIETIFVLNNCKAHPNYNQISANPTFSLANIRNAANVNAVQFSHHGQENFEKRMSIYVTFLTNMKDEHRFLTMNRLVKDILLEVSEERFDIEQCHGVIYDTLSILASKEIKLQSINALKSTIENADGEEMSEKQVQSEEAKGKFLTLVQKKAIIESIIPILVELKTLFEKKRSNLTRLVVAFFRELFKDYKKELSEFLGANRQLEKEIEYDIKNLNKKQVQSPMKQNPSSLQMGQTPMKRRSLGGVNINGSPSVGSGGPIGTPTKPDMSNFLVPQVRTPKPPGSNRRLSIATTTPTLKPFNQPLGRLSVTPMKPSPTTTTTTTTANSTEQQSTPFKQGSNNLFGSNLGGSTTPFANRTPIRSAMRHSIGGIPSSAYKSNNSTPSVRFNDTEDQQPIPPPKFTTIPSSLPIRIPMEVKNSLGADIVLPNPDKPPTIQKWNISFGNDDDKKMKDAEEEEHEEEHKEEQKGEEKAEVEEEEEETVQKKRGRKPQTSKISTRTQTLSKETTVNNKPQNQSENEKEEKEVILPKRTRKPSSSTTTTTRSRRQQPIELEQEEEEIVQVKKRGKTSNSKSTPTTTTKKRK